MLTIGVILFYVFLSAEGTLVYTSTNTHVGSMYGKNLTEALLDIIKSIPVYHLCLVYDNNTNQDFIHWMIRSFESRSMSLAIYDVSSDNKQEEYFSYVSYHISNSLDMTSLFFCNHRIAEYLLIEFTYRNLIRRNLLLMFYWGQRPIARYFIRSLHEMLRTVVITNPRNHTFRIYYNQATSYKRHHLTLINWWNTVEGLSHRPTLPAVKPIFKNFNQKNFVIPVLHKPPWFFVEYNNETIEVTGGRDDMIVALLASELNFNYTYVSPTELHETYIFGEGSLEEMLVQIGNREIDFFLGDVSLTLARLEVVEFSFMILADSMAFITHAPSRLNEALALIRPFNWRVWPAMIATVIISGATFYVLVALPNTWQPRELIRSHTTLLFDCYWFTLTLLFKQTGRQMNSSQKFRFFTIIISMSATYIIADMYSANLTSLLARPGREKAINNLFQLEEAMLTKNYKLLMESSTHSLFENGSGVYERIWNIMSKQSSLFVNSMEDGVQLVSNSTNVALIGGRETLFFDIQRFGAKKFHLSEKLNTAYSAIAFQIGCPYLENVNDIIMSIFEAGILTKMTENEYEKLGKSQTEVNRGSRKTVVPAGKKTTRKAAKAMEETEKSKPISIKMLQGAFYLLLIGDTFAMLALVGEMLTKHYEDNIFLMKRRTRANWKKMGKRGNRYIIKYLTKIQNIVQNMLNEAIIETLEYLD